MSAPAATHVARALAIAAFRAGHGAAGDAALARIASPDVAAARAMLVAMHGPDGVALVTRVRRELAAPRPAHWRTVHATWLDELLAGEGVSVRAAVLGDGNAPHERHLARAFLGGLHPMPDPATLSAHGVASLVALDPRRLGRTVVILGRRQLAHALGAGSRRDAAELALRLTWGKELIGEVAALAAIGDEADRRAGRRKSAIARTSDLVWTESMSSSRAGLRALAPAVARVPELAEPLVQRLSRSVGLVARVELAAFAVPVDGADDLEIAQAIARASVRGEP